MKFLEVHNETEKNAVLEPLRCFIPVVARPKTIIISLSLKLISFFFCEIFFFFLLYFGSLVFATECDLGLSQSYYGGSVVLENLKNTLSQILSCIS